jgi:hypothetical protein
MHLVHFSGISALSLSPSLASAPLVRTQMRVSGLTPKEADAAPFHR